VSEAIKTGLWKRDGNNGYYYSGKIEVNGQEFWVNLYKNDRKTQESHPDLNLQLKPKENSGKKAAQKAVHQVNALGEPDDTIPW